MRALSSLFHVSEDSIARHKANHLAPVVRTAARQIEAERQHRIDVMGELDTLRTIQHNLMVRAYNQGDADIALRASNALRKSLELVAKMQGDLAEPGISITSYTQTVQVLLSEIDDPEQRKSLALRLMREIE
jgi:hypothetical protein